MTWWKTSVEGNRRNITIYFFNWKVFLALLLGGFLGGLSFFVLAWLKSS
jgi:hypothetical protein